MTRPVNLGTKMAGLAVRLAASGRRRLARWRAAGVTDAQRRRLVEDLSVLVDDALAPRDAIALAQKRLELPVTGEPDGRTRRIVGLRAAQVRLEERLGQLEAARPQRSPYRANAPGTSGSLRHVRVRLTGLDGPVSLDFVGGADLFVLRKLAEHGLGGYEPATLATVLAAAEETGGPFLDIGANVGVFALTTKALIPRCEVVAFEPSAPLAATLSRLAAANDLRVGVEQLALSDHDGRAEFYLSPTDTSNSLREGFRRHVGVVTVPVLRLDTWLADHPGVQPTVCKVDTETTELDVLAGGGDYVLRQGPRLVVEVLAGRPGAGIEAWCRRHGYLRHHILDGGPQLRERVVGDNADMNWLLTPEPLSADFHAAVARWRRILDASVTVDQWSGWTSRGRVR